LTGTRSSANTCPFTKSCSRGCTMGRDANFWQTVEQIREKDPRFEPQAYALVMESLDFTLKRLGERRHVSADELLRGLCDHAKERYGLLAYSVIESWGITATSDVGRIVYHLIDAGVLAKQENDRFEEFDIFDTNSWNGY
jgi:uncharacterized repeat protein (TIGR04138 family)